MTIDEELAKEWQERASDVVNIAGQLGAADAAMRINGDYGVTALAAHMFEIMAMAHDRGLELIAFADDESPKDTVIEISQFSDDRFACIELHTFKNIDAEALKKRMDNIRDTLLLTDGVDGQKA